MVRYVPAEALAFVEIDSLADLADGLTSTNAWREIGPALSLSSQLRQMGFFADLTGPTKLFWWDALNMRLPSLVSKLRRVRTKKGHTST
jgi:hypothetical protein